MTQNVVFMYTVTARILHIVHIVNEGGGWQLAARGCSNTKIRSNTADAIKSYALLLHVHD